MPPEELRSMIVDAIRDGAASPWWIYALAILLSTAGAYFGSYIRQKGETRANNENFDDLREQLRKTTHDTEFIKNSLSGRTWLTQQQWEIRETHYVGLLTHLTKLKLSLQDRYAKYSSPGSEYDQEISETPHFQRLERIGSEAYQAIRELIGPASIFLSAKAIDALEALVREHWDVAEHSICTADYVATALKLVRVAQEAVLVEARKDLAHWQPPECRVAMS